MSISSTENDRRLVEELAKNFSYEVLEDFLIRKKFTIKLEKIYLEDKLIDEYGIKKLKLFATKQVDQQPFHVYTLELTTTLTDRSSKKRQFDIAKRLLNTHLVNTGLFIFHDNLKNFRFSLVYKIPIGTKVKYSYYKRYTFYVSPNLPNKTFILQIGQCEFDTFENIKSAFSVEPVTKQFYGELQAWYYYAMNQAKFPEDYKYSDDSEKDREIRTALNLIRLITRLIFIWFLKEKELIPEILFDEKQLKNIVKDFGNGHNYYNAILQNLFFATLNRPINERGWAYDKGYPANKSNFGVKSLYRYEDKFLIQSNEVMKLFSTIPFINGGLFDCLDKDKVYIDGFSRNEKKQAKISDELFFSSEEKTVDLSKYGLSKNAKVRGLIDILKSYNFTTDEATPIDQEIALDPELLGKVFENLLASYNPETATTARKATGSYYTSREIVDYMVEESLREYLKTEVPEAQDILDDLFSYSVEELDISKDLRLKLIQEIDQIKIIDPACGSGAFPMGILQKLVHLLQRLDPDNKYWYELQYERAIKASEEVFNEKDKAEREEILKEINEAFDESINYPDYARKLYLIENCIYGVDIQPIAIQISKLRFFISLVIDQKVDKEKENYGIRPLPNLETKFVLANTLIGLERPKQLQLRNQEIEKKEKELKDIRHRYFTAKTRAGKLKLQEKDKEIRKEIAKLLINNNYPDDTANKIASFDLFDQNASTDWFDPEWMFGIVEGFDIVIGNPPYIKEYTNRKAFDGLRDSPYYQGKMDIWYLFACKGIDFLKNKGILTFIAQNNWITSYGASKMRNKVVEECKILQLLDFGSYFIFGSSDIQTMIMIFQKSSEPEEYSFDLRKIIGKKPVYKDVIDLLNKIPNPNNEYLNPTINRNKYLNKTLTFTKTNIEAILNRIDENGKERLYENEITQGIVIPQDYVIEKHIKKLGQGFKVGDGIFVLSNEEKNNIPFTEKELELIKPYYTSKELKKYYGNRKNSEWIIYTDSRFKNPGAIKPYPNIKKHLDKFQKVITSDNKPYGLHRARDERFFKGEKIIALRKCVEPTFTYTDFDCYVSAAFYVIKTNRFNLKYLTGLLNSKLIAFWLRHKGKMQGNNYQIDKEPLLNIPIPPITDQNQPIVEQIIQKVEEILTLTQPKDYDVNQAKQENVKMLELEIDKLVYNLYGLTEEEIKIIEGRYNG